MHKRRGWAGLLGVVGLSVAFACNDPEPSPDEPQDPVPGEDSQRTASEGEPIARFQPRPCPTLTDARAQIDTVEIPANQGRAIRLPGGGRNHSLLVWAQRSVNRRLVLSEMKGDTNGVQLAFAEGVDSTGEPWGLLTLDARGCTGEGDPYIVKRHDDGTLTVPGGGYDSATVSAFAVLRGNSGYMLATPD